MFVFATHYDGDWRWIPEYTDDFVVYNRSSEDIPNSVPRENIGDADYDKLSWLVENYDNLPEVFLWTKSNLFKFITPEEWDKVKDNKTFTPLLTQNHKVYDDEHGPVAFYKDGMYHERNDSWYIFAAPALHFPSYSHFANHLGIPNPPYLPFAPGGSYILTRDAVHKHDKSLYERMMSFLPYTQRPGEAMMAERSYYSLWH